MTQTWKAAPRPWRPPSAPYANRGHRPPAHARREHPLQDRRETPYAGWVILGTITGFVVIGIVVAFVLTRSPAEDEPEQLIAAMPREVTFELVASTAADKLVLLFPSVNFTDRADVPAYEAYLNDAIMPAREALALHTPPSRLEDVTHGLIGALDQYVVAFGAAATCMRGDEPCIPQRHDLRMAADDVLTRADDLERALE